MRRGAKGEIAVAQPLTRHHLIAAHNGIELAKETNEKHGKFEWLAVTLQKVILPFHARDGRLGNADHRSQYARIQSQPLGGIDNRLGDDGSLTRR